MALRQAQTAFARHLDELARHGIMQQDLAQAVDISPQSISGYKHMAALPSLRQAQRMARKVSSALGCKVSTDDLFPYEEGEPGDNTTPE